MPNEYMYMYMQTQNRRLDFVTSSGMKFFFKNSPKRNNISNEYQYIQINKLNVDLNYNLNIFINCHAFFHQGSFMDEGQAKLQIFIGVKMQYFDSKTLYFHGAKMFLRKIEKLLFCIIVQLLLFVKVLIGDFPLYMFYKNLNKRRKKILSTFEHTCTYIYKDYITVCAAYKMFEKQITFWGSFE